MTTLNRTILELSKQDRDLSALLGKDPVANLCFQRSLQDADATPETLWRDIALFQSASKHDILNSIAGGAYGLDAPHFTVTTP
jgi:hypothetical protein